MRHGWYFIICLAACSPTATGSGPQQAGPSQTVRTTVAPQETVDLTRQTMLHAVEFGYERDKVWNAVLLAHEELGIPLLGIDAKAGTVVYQFQDRNRTVAGKLVSNYIDCGRTTAGPRADTYRLTIRITQQVTSSSEGMTRMSTHVAASARHPGMSADVIACESTGELEKKLVGLVAARL